MGQMGECLGHMDLIISYLDQVCGHFKNQRLMYDVLPFGHAYSRLLYSVKYENLGFVLVAIMAIFFPNFAYCEVSNM